MQYILYVVVVVVVDNFKTNVWPPVGIIHRPKQRTVNSKLSKMSKICLYFFALNGKVNVGLPQ